MSTAVLNRKPIKLSPKTREEWLSLRQGIGSSEVATILGVNKWETPYQLWLRKTGQVTAKEETFAMRMGHYLEDAVGQCWEDETNRKIIKSSASMDIYVHPEKDFLRVSPDRTFWLDGPKNDDNKGVLECKTTRMPVSEDDVPLYWFCQLQYQLGIMQRDFGSVAWLVQGSEFGYRDFNLVPDFFAEMVDKAEEFYYKNIIEGIEPELISEEDVILKYPKHMEGKVVEATEQIAIEYARLADVKAQIKELDKRKSEHEEQIKLFMGDAEWLMYADQKLASWKAPKDSTKFNLDAFKKEHPSLYETYLVNQPSSRRMLLK